MSSTKTPTNPNKYSTNINTNIDNDTDIIYENKVQIDLQPSLPKFSSVMQNMKNLITKNISLHLYKNALFYAVQLQMLTVIYQELCKSVLIQFSYKRSFLKILSTLFRRKQFLDG